MHQCPKRVELLNNDMTLISSFWGEDIQILTNILTTTNPRQFPILLLYFKERGRKREGDTRENSFNCFFFLLAREMLCLALRMIYWEITQIYLFFLLTNVMLRHPALVRKDFSANIKIVWISELYKYVFMIFVSWFSSRNSWWYTLPSIHSL